MEHQALAMMPTLEVTLTPRWATSRSRLTPWWPPTRRWPTRCTWPGTRATLGATPTIWSPPPNHTRHWTHCPDHLQSWLHSPRTEDWRSWGCWQRTLTRAETSKQSTMDNPTYWLQISRQKPSREREMTIHVCILHMLDDFEKIYSYIENYFTCNTCILSVKHISYLCKKMLDSSFPSKHKHFSRAN